MERIRTFLKTFDGQPINAQKMMYDCDSKWGQLNTGLPFDMDTAAILIDEYVKGRTGVTVEEPTELPSELKVAEADGKVTESELLAMNRSSLREYAAKMGISTGAFTKKADIIAAITAKP